VGLAGCSAGPLSDIKAKFSFNLPVLGFRKKYQEMAEP